MHLNYRILLIFNLVFLCRVGSDCQISELQFETYTAKNNWPQDLLEAPLQDKYGYLWIAIKRAII